MDETINQTDGPKLIFLDVDGVLNNNATFKKAMKLEAKSGPWGLPIWPDTEEAYHKAQIEDRFVALVNELAERTGAKVVISSTWRLLFYEQLLKWLPEKGLKAPIIGRTPKVNARDFELEPWKTERGLEIEFWCRENIPEDQLPNLRLVILDDDSDMGRLMRWLVRTSERSGIEQRHVEKAVRVLTQEPPAGLKILSPFPNLTEERLAIYGL